MTVYFPVWHPHRISARFTVMVSCSDELAVHSCPLLCLQRQFAEVASGCSTVGLLCVTITWSQIFKGALRVNGSRRFACMWLLNQGRIEVRWSPGQEASLSPPCSNLRSFGSKCTVLKNMFVPLLGLFGHPRSHSTLPAVI